MLTKLREANDVGTVHKVTVWLDKLESLIRDAGLYSTKEIRPVNEARFEARWKLGKLLKRVERAKPRPEGRTISRSGKWFGDYLKENGINKNRTSEAQRIGAMPEAELRRAFAASVEEDILNTISRLISVAKPYWHIEKRQQTHADIQAHAAAQQRKGKLGPFPLIYADPAWKFITYSDKAHGTPDDHYPTLTDDQIINFKVNGQTVPELAAKSCVLFLWCTSANILRAVHVMEQWGFEYRTHAMWDKIKVGQGLIFRNQHEVLLYGVRGKPPKPMIIPPSVFRYRATTHSTKPPEIRQTIMEMYPQLTEKTRLEMFSRSGHVKGWSHVGFEAETEASGG
jgi:N6-adenosine-specific RNA methylase IME4